MVDIPGITTPASLLVYPAHATYNRASCISSLPPGRRVIQRHQKQDPAASLTRKHNPHHAHNDHEPLQDPPDQGDNDEDNCKVLSSCVASDLGSGSITSGPRRRGTDSETKGGGHQKRHQEWLDKFGEVNCAGVTHRHVSLTCLCTKFVYIRPVLDCQLG